MALSYTSSDVERKTRWGASSETQPSPRTVSVENKKARGAKLSGDRLGPEGRTLRIGTFYTLRPSLLEPPSFLHTGNASNFRFQTKVRDQSRSLEQQSLSVNIPSCEGELHEQVDGGGIPNLTTRFGKNRSFRKRETYLQWSHCRSCVDSLEYCGRMQRRSDKGTRKVS